MTAANLSDKWVTGFVEIVFEDGSKVRMTLRDGVRFMESLVREGWEICDVPRPGVEEEPHG